MTQALMPYCGPAPAPDQLWSSWNLDPWVLIGIAALALVLARKAVPDRRGPAARRTEIEDASAWLEPPPPPAGLRPPR